MSRRQPPLDNRTVMPSDLFDEIHPSLSGNRKKQRMPQEEEFRNEGDTGLLPEMDLFRMGNPPEDKREEKSFEIFNPFAKKKSGEPEGFPAPMTRAPSPLAPVPAPVAAPSPSPSLAPSSRTKSREELLEENTSLREQLAEARNQIARAKTKEEEEPKKKETNFWDELDKVCPTPKLIPLKYPKTRR